MSENNDLGLNSSLATLFIKDFNSDDKWIYKYFIAHKQTYPLVKIQLKQISIIPSEKTLQEEHSQDYPTSVWEKLKSSILKNGLKEPITVYEAIKKGQMSYGIMGGHHRACTLLNLYGEDYKVSAYVQERRTFTEEIPHLNKHQIKVKNIINVHKESTHDTQTQMKNNMDEEIRKKMVTIHENRFKIEGPNKSRHESKIGEFTRVNKTYKDYL